MLYEVITLRAGRSPLWRLLLPAGTFRTGGHCRGAGGGTAQCPRAAGIGAVAADPSYNFV